ncbi:MAG: hypothetical protein WA160_16245 [Pseudobdellovibrio sp.]
MFSISSKGLVILASSLLSLLAFSEEMHIVYRSFSGKDYLFSTSAIEGPKAGYFPEEARFSLSATSLPNTRPLFRCRIKTNGSSHFLSPDASCEGQVVEGLLGYMSSIPQPNLKSLNRYVLVATNSHIDIVQGDEVNFAGWKFEGTHGYVEAIELPAVIQTPDDGKKYFGFYAGAMDSVAKQNYIPELAKYSNLIFIKSENIEDRLIECEKYGLKAIITFDWLFFDDNFRLKADYAEKFKSIEPILHKHASTIAAFYGQDEPYTNGLNRKISVAEIYNGQETMGRFLKSKFPNIPIGVILTTDELRASLPLFPSYDWFGFDCYSSSLKCGGKTVDWYYDHLNTMLNVMIEKDHKQRFLISVPQAGHAVKDGAVRGEKDIMLQVPEYRNLVKKYSNVKVVMPFIWQSFNDGNSNWIGAREMPAVKSVFETFYIDFIAGHL